MKLVGSVFHRGMRRVAFYVHVVTGLGLGLWLVLVSLTGSLVMFRGEIEDALHSDLTRVTPGDEWVSLEGLFGRVMEGNPGASFRTVNLPTSKDRSVSFWGHDAKGRSFHVHADPYTGEVLGSDLADRNPTEWLYLFHAQLLGGGTGERINGLGAIAWVGLLGSGLMLWWPRKGRRWGEGFVVRWGVGNRRRNYDLHRAVGIWTVIPLMVVVVTGAYFPFKAPFRWLAETMTRTPAVEEGPRTEPIAPGTKRVTLDEVMRAAGGVLPEAKPNWIGLPEGGRQLFSVRKRLAGEWRMEGANHIHVDAHSGAVVQTDLHTERTPAQRMMRAMFPLHVGTFGGLLTRVVWTVLGLVPTVLFVTGIRMWWRRRGGGGGGREVEGNRERQEGAV
jgi:uncharacterized iron-regulated membrane protein